VEHISFPAENTISLDFLGKDSMRYQNVVKVDPLVYKNLMEFVKGKSPSDDLFDKINVGLNNIVI